MSGMQVQKIRLQNFRQFLDPVEISGLESGLNVIAGDNEAGKSTLVRGIRAALFDRHGSNVGQSFQPYGAEVVPLVELTFSLGDIEYQLSKAFSTKASEKHVKLTSSLSEVWEGAAAEERLEELLGFQHSQRGATKLEQQGLSGLLWIEQGSAYNPVELTADSKNRIQSVFQNEMQELLGGEQGSVIKQRIDKARSEYFGQNDNPVKDYRKAIELEHKIREEAEERRAALKEYEDQVDELSDAREKLDDSLQERLVERAHEDLQNARVAQTNLQTLKNNVELGRAAVEAQAQTHGRAIDRWQVRQDLIQEMNQAEADLASANESIRGKNQALEPVRTQYEACNEKIEHARKAARKSGQELEQARAYERVTNLQNQLDAVTGRLDRAVELTGTRNICIAERDIITLTQEDLDEVAALERDLDRATIALESAATSIEHDIQEKAKVTLGEQPLRGEGSVRVSEATTIAIHEVGQLRIVPGGAELDGLKHQAESLEAVFTTKLTELGYPDIAALGAAFDQRKALDQRANELKAEISGIAPEGVDDLQEQKTSLGAQIESLQAKTGEAPEELPDLQTLEGKAEEAEQEFRRLEEDLEPLEVSRQALEDGLQELKADRRSAEREVERKRAALSNARDETADDDLETAKSETEQQLDEIRSVYEAAQQELEQIDADLIDSEVERLTAWHQQASGDRNRLERRIEVLKEVLTQSGQSGLAEQLAEKEAEHTLAKLEMERQQRQAHALDLLSRTLDEAYEEARREVARPIVDKLLPYLKRLLRDSTPVIDENLELTGIQREGFTERFDDLSIGTREQLAILLRLAYADLLSERDIPVTIVMDDALVNSDDERRDRMKSILYQASSRYQIIMLTCHGREFRDTGGQFIPLT